MTISIEEFNRLKKHAEEKSREVSQAEGALKQVMSDLKEQFGCETIEQAQAKLAELELQEKAAETAYNVELEAYKAKWGDQLK